MPFISKMQFDLLSIKPALCVCGMNNPIVQPGGTMYHID